MRSLIRVFDGHSMGSQEPNVSTGGTLRLWSDCAHPQTDLNLRCAHMPNLYLMMDPGSSLSWLLKVCWLSGQLRLGVIDGKQTNFDLAVEYQIFWWLSYFLTCFRKCIKCLFLYMYHPYQHWHEISHDVQGLLPWCMWHKIVIRYLSTFT